ncbi:MAG: hypothetical protein PHW63_04810 [Alphaproteobacteria bacterium]|nr:hypothetical protein [Alphaproteobacteria bacterium]
MAEIKIGESLVDVRAKAIAGVLDAVRTAETAYCVMMMQAIGTVIKLTVPSLNCVVTAGKYWKPVELAVTNADRTVNMVVEIRDGRQKEGAKAALCRYATVQDRTNIKNTVWDIKLPLCGDVRFAPASVGLFEIATPEVSEAIKKIIGVDINDDPKKLARPSSVREIPNDKLTP